MMVTARERAREAMRPTVTTCRNAEEGCRLASAGHVTHDRVDQAVGSERCARAIDGMHVDTGSTVCSLLQTSFGAPDVFAHNQ